MLMKVRIAVACIMVSLAVTGNLEASVKDALAESGVSGGLIVHLGCGSQKETEGLKINDRFVVHGLYSDKSNPMESDVVGVSFMHLAGNNLPYADNLVNLVIVDGRTSKVEWKEIQRVLAPRGIAVFPLSLRSQVSALSPESVGDWLVYRKPVPADIDEWTHWQHDAGGNMASGDKLVGPPRYVQWNVGPLWQRHHGMIPSILNIVSASGRLFNISDEAPMTVSGIPGNWRLTGRDAFNGKLLWKREVPDWGPTTWSYYTESHASRFNHPINIRERMTAVGDRVYVTLGFNAPVSVLDAADGKTVMTIRGSEYTDEIVVHEGTLYLSVNEGPVKSWPGEGVSPFPTERPPVPRKKVMAFDAESGNKKWETESLDGFAAGVGRMEAYRQFNLKVSGEGVFINDRNDVVCLEPASGKERWRVPKLYSPNKKAERDESYYYHCYFNANLQMMMAYGALLFLQQPTRDEAKYGFNSATVLQAIDPETGKELWRFNCGPSGYLERPNVFGIGDLVWAVGPGGKEPSKYVGLNMRTGKVEKTLDVTKAYKDVGHHQRCYPDKATPNYIITARRGAEFAPLDGSELSVNHWARSGCRTGTLPANGLFYRPPDHCRCYLGFQPRGFFAFASDASVGVYKDRLTDENPLEKGPAYATEVSALSPQPSSDWPTFRHDNARSGSTDASVPAGVRQAWVKKFGSSVSAPVIAGGTVYVSLVDAHRVVALDAETGTEKWAYHSNARVDSPPTVSGRLVLFGTRTGWVYCLRASDGELAWRFRAAPGERLIMSYNQLESPWPVNGSVLVSGGKVVFTAGRSSLIDGGVYLYVLDAVTGKMLEKKNYSETQERAGTKLKNIGVDGVFSDILVMSGNRVTVNGDQLDISTPLDQDIKRPAVTSPTGFFDSFWFNRTAWQGGGVEAYMISCEPGSTYYATGFPRGVKKGSYSFLIPEGGTDAGVVNSRSVNWLGSTYIRDGVILARKSAKQGGWSQKTFEICPWAMAVTKEKLLVAGFRLKTEKDDPWAAFEGRKGGRLVMMDKSSGKRLAEYELESPPVWNGIAVVDGMVVLSCRDGSLVCLKGKNDE